MIACHLPAQSRDPVSIDATIGLSTGSGGRLPYYSSDGIAGEITLTFRPHPERETAGVVAATVGGQSHFDGYGDKCVVNPEYGSGCLPAFPSFSHVGVLGGVEGQWPGFAMRALAGPAFYGGGGASGIGGQLHLDGAIGFTHLAFVVAIRGCLVARVTGETLRSHSLEFGLRVQ